MPPEPSRIQELSRAACDRADPAERAAFLDRECGGDIALRARVDAALAARRGRDVAPGQHRAGGDLAPTDVAEQGPPATEADLGGPAGGEGQEETAAGFPETAAGDGETTGGGTRGEGQGSPIGTVVAGRYEIRGEIGEGGMGSVYLAEQARPVRRQVALKLIRAGMDSRAVLARFEGERQALAMMDHPNIARVLDAGTTGGGRPFFVMELVRGVPLTGYCDANRLDLAARLALFRQICSAVQHAHQKGVIHRDLKPSNILVEEHDGRPVPKVIDFGLAKATSGAPLTDRTLATAPGSFAGTPLYMAPEQARFDAVDVDTRADIYALGVILYELLAGSTPIRREAIRAAGLDEVLRMVREVEPPTPSGRIGASGGLDAIAAARRVEPARLARLVRGDLDWIAMKALAKERGRRYDSAIGLARDLERFADHEPVGAGPPSARYRLGKFVRRNRGRVAAAALVLAALLAGVVGTTLGMLEARRLQGLATAATGRAEEARGAEVAQRARAEEQAARAEKRLAQVAKMNEILGAIVRELDPRRGERDGKPLMAFLGERLGPEVTEVEGEAVGDPLDVAKIRQILGEFQVGQGDAGKAIALIGGAYEARSKLLGPDHDDTLYSLNGLAWAHQVAGHFDRAIDLFDRMTARRAAKAGPDDPAVLAGLNNLAWAHLAAGDLGRAVPLFERVLARREATLGADDPKTLYSLNSLAWAYQVAGRYDRALPTFERALQLRGTRLGPDHPDTLLTMNDLARTCVAAGEVGRGVALFEQALAARTAGLGADHPDTIVSLNGLAWAHQVAGDLGRAVPLFERAVELARSRFGPDHPDTLYGMGNLAWADLAAGKADRAAPLFERVLATRRARLGPDHSATIAALEGLIRACVASGRRDRVLPIYRENADLPGRRIEASPAPSVAAAASLVRGLLADRCWPEAEAVCADALKTCEAREPDAWSTFEWKSLLGAALLGGGKPAEAAPVLLAGYEGLKSRAGRVPAPEKARVGEALDRLIALAEATGKPEEAGRRRDEKAKLAAEAAGPKGP